MKYIILLFCIIFAFAQNSFTQSREEVPIIPASDSKFVAGFRVGPSFGIGEFGEIDVTNEKAGLALTGIQLNGNVSYLFTESFYLVLDAGYASNPIDENELLIPIKNSVPSNVNVSITSSSWNSKSLNIGVGTRTEIDQKMKFVTKFGLGFYNTVSPGYAVTATDGTTIQFVSQSSSTANNLNLNLGASIVKEINSTTFFTVGLDYLKVVQDFEDIAIKSTVNGTPNGPTIFFDSSQDIETISITIGVSVKI